MFLLVLLLFVFIYCRHWGYFPTVWGFVSAVRRQYSCPSPWSSLFCHQNGGSLTTQASSALDAWISSNRLRLNPDKKQFMWPGGCLQLDNIHTGSLHLRFTSPSISLLLVTWESFGPYTLGPYLP